MQKTSIRDAVGDDARQMLAIYEPFVRKTAVSFELETPSVEQFQATLVGGLESHPWLVGVNDGEVMGYAYATQHRARGAYRYSVESSVYVKEECRRTGLGRLLYGELFHRLSDRGFCNAYAGVTLPNPSSELFHRAMGFERIGVFPSVGHKFGRWHDLSWWYRKLRSHPIGHGE